MLSIGAMAGGQGHYYQHLAKEDYYLHGGEPVGKWWGKGAEHFGLADKKVTAKTLESLLNGRSPKGDDLVQNAGGKANKERRPGFDLSFSAPKTVSALWATASPEIQKEIQAAQDAAVKAALTYLERTGAFTRTGKGGVNRHEAALIVALFEHGTSRAMDPQLHTHALLMNLGLMEDGRVRALVHTEFFSRKMAAGAIYRVQLAEELQNRLGVRIEQDPHAYRKGGLGFKVVGVSESLCDFWSKRRHAIEKQLGEWGVESAASAAAANKATRIEKGMVPPRGELFEQWREEARRFGILPQVLRAFRTREDRDPAAAFEVAMAKTLREMTADPESRLEAKTIGGRLAVKTIDAFLGGDNERTFGLSHFSETLLLRRLAENCQGKGIDVSTLLDRFANAIEKNPSLIRLGKSAKGEELFTTQESLDREKQIIHSAGTLSARKGHGVDAEDVGKAIEKYNRKHPKTPLGPERADAVIYLTSRNGGSVRCLEGLAGSAKTSTLSVVKDLYEKQGYKVIGIADAGKAVKALRDSGKGEASLLSVGGALHVGKQLVRAALDKPTKPYEPGGFDKTYTLKLFEMVTGTGFGKWFAHQGYQLFREARGRSTFKYNPVGLDSKTVVICDEASMIATREMAMLVDRVKKAGGLLILVGDREQIQAVGQGGSFAHIADRFGKVEITDIVRQRNKIDREAVEDVLEGRAAKMLKNFADRGLLKVEKDRDKASEMLVKEWQQFERGKKKGDSLIFVGTNKDAEDINRRCQRARLDAGELNFVARTRVGDTTFYRGDRILFRKNSSSIGVNNGETGTVIAINPTPILKTLTVKLDDGQKVVVPVRDYKNISLGYAVTTHKGQGTTVERAYVLLGGGMQDKEISYVQASRAKGETRLYTTEADAGTEHKELARQMEKSNAKTLAHTIAAEAVAEAERIRQELLRQQQRTQEQTMKR